jgi:hypothetical protein
MHGGLNLAKNNKPGPKPKPGPRYPSGQRKAKHQSRHMSREEVQMRAPVLWQRIIQHGAALGVDPRLQSVLGRLAIYGHLTPTAVTVGQYIADITGKYERSTGMPKREGASPSYDKGFKGGATNPYDTNDGEIIARYERRVKKITKQYNRLMAMIPPSPSLAHQIVMDVCVNNIEVNSAHYEDLERLFQEMARKLGYVPEAQQKPDRKVVPIKRDAYDIANGIVDTLDFSITKERVTKFSWRLDVKGDDNGLRISGTTGSGQPFNKAVRMKARGTLHVAALQSALVKAAQAKWGEAAEGVVIEKEPTRLEGKDTLRLKEEA